MAFETRGPAAGDRGGTVRTVAIGGEAIILDQIAVALDQSFMALRAARVFPLADHAGKIAGVDVAEARLAADFDGLQQIFDSGVAGDIVLHFVIAVKGGDVPRDIGRDAGEEFGEAAQFVGSNR